MIPKTPATPERVFYDGHCGACHWAVRFVATRDDVGTRFRFAPLCGETFERTVPETLQRSIPDSLVVMRGDGVLYLRSDAVVHVLRRLGGGWGLLGALMRLIPRPLRDWGYDRFAAIRHRFFARPEAACPLIPAAWRDRFEP